MWLLFALVQRLSLRLVKTFRLIALAKKISKKPNLDTVLWLIHVEDDFDETMQT